MCHGRPAFILYLCNIQLRGIISLSRDNTTMETKKSHFETLQLQRVGQEQLTRPRMRVPAYLSDYLVCVSVTRLMQPPVLVCRTWQYLRQADQFHKEC